MYKKYIKRIIDIFLSFIALPFFAIIFVPVAILILFEDRGPVFYNAPRLGKDGKVFKMYKFRSMKVNAPDIRNSDGSTYNSSEDPRLTKIGKFVRKTSIDELPQILNVLKGEMSFIGPRPDLPEAVNYYDELIIKKLKVNPGISGYNQAYFRNSINTVEKWGNDAFYVDNLNFMLDVKIFLKTIFSVLFKRNVYIDDKREETIFH